MRMPIGTILFGLALWGGEAPLRAGGPPRVEEGVLLRDGAPLHAIGVNYHDGFLRMVDARTPEAERGHHRGAFATLAERGVPFVRFMAGGYYPDDWALYRENRDEWFRRLDEFVAEAERSGVGLAPSLFWACFTVPDMVGEPLSAWGEEGSATRAFMRRYTEEIVTRYRGSPAIWVWEFGNEYLLRADLPNPPDRGTVVPARGTARTRGEADKISSAAIRAAYEDFARLVRRLDPERPISGGDALPRPGAWHLRRGEGWGPDTDAQFAEVLAEDAPAPMDLVSVHVYPKAKQARPAAESIRLAGEAARRAGKVLFIGEFGANKDLPEPAREAETRALFEALVEQRVQLAAVWVFDSRNPGTAHHNITPANEHAYVLDLLAEANRRLAELARR